jgi:hypothetical protein
MSIQKANKNEVRKEIADLINRIKEQSDRIGMQREIPQSELDLILHRIEELHRRTVVWSYLNELPEEVIAPVTTAEIKTAPVQTAQPLTPPPVPAPEPVVVKQVEPEPQKEPLKGPVINEAPVTPEPPHVVEPAKVPVMPEPPKAEEPKISVPPPAHNPEPRTTSLKDIKTFIGFNEKLMYIRQVFKGDSAAYEAALAGLNAMRTWDEAQAFLSVLAAEYKWGKHDEPADIFTQTVKRRFS